MSTFSTAREIPATVEQVFAAFSQPETPGAVVGTYGVYQ